jgi:site-specific recombinase XerD
VINIFACFCINKKKWIFSGKTKNVFYIMDICKYFFYNKNHVLACKNISSYQTIRNSIRCLYLFIFHDNKLSLDLKFTFFQTSNKKMTDFVQLYISKFWKYNQHQNQARKRRRISSKGFDKTETTLRSLLNTLEPANLTETPTCENLKKIQFWVQNHMRTLSSRKRFIAKIQCIGLHPEFTTKFLDTSLTSNQMLLYNRIKAYSKTSLVKSVFLSHLLALKKITGDFSSHTLSLNAAAVFCLERINLKTTRPLIIKFTGFTHGYKELKLKINYLKQVHGLFQTTKIQCLAQNDNVKLWKWSVFAKFVLKHGEPKVFKDTYSHPDALSAFESAKDGKYAVWRLYRIHFQELGLKDLVTFIENKGSYHLTKISNVDKFKQMSPWHFEVYTHYIKYESENRTGNVSIIQTNDHVKLTQFASFMMFLENYVENMSVECFLKTATINMIKTMLIAKCKNVTAHNERVVGRNRIHQSTSILSLVMYFLNGPLSVFINCHEHLHLLNRRQLLQKAKNNCRIPASVNIRRSYTKEEIQRMLNCAKDPAEKTVLTILHRVALRASATGNIQYHQLFDENHIPRKECRVFDKGNKHRGFMMSEDLKACCVALSKFLRNMFPNQDLTNCYPFNLRNIKQRYKASSLRSMLQRVAKEAKITGVRVHPHAWRHTYVENLVDLGIAVEDVSKLIGHSHVGTTINKYYTPTQQKLYEKVKHAMEGKVQLQDKQKEQRIGLKTTIKLVQNLDSILQKHISRKDYAKIQMSLRKEYPDAHSDLTAAMECISSESEEEEEEEEEESVILNTHNNKPTIFFYV